MKILVEAMLLVGGALSGFALAQTDAPQPILIESLHWTSPPIPGLQVAWVLGSEQHTGLYVLRVRLDEGARIPPHTHPDERHTTVLAGTIFVGFGERFDKPKLVAIPTGAVYVAPAGIPHYLWAKKGHVVYQESGFGPTGTVISEPE